MNKIGGSMGPLYGSIFMGMQEATLNKDRIDGEVIRDMLNIAYENIQMISNAKPNDKTLVDVLDLVLIHIIKFMMNQKML